MITAGSRGVFLKGYGNHCKELWYFNSVHLLSKMSLKSSWKLPSFGERILLCFLIFHWMSLVSGFSSLIQVGIKKNCKSWTLKLQFSPGSEKKMHLLIHLINNWQVCTLDTGVTLGLESQREVWPDPCFLVVCNQVEGAPTEINNPSSVWRVSGGRNIGGESHTGLGRRITEDY